MRFEYKTPTGLAHCDVTLGEIPGTRQPVAVFQELPDNAGMSVTNAIEVVATLVYHRYFRPLGFSMTEVMWVTNDLDNVGSVVTLKSELGRYHSPRWRYESTLPMIEEFT